MKRLFLLTVLEAFVRSLTTTKKGSICFLQFFSTLTKKAITLLNLPE